MNRALCNSCRQVVEAENLEREGKVFLVKHCPTCGDSETLISSDAERYNNKRCLDGGFDYQACMLNCDTCRAHQCSPTLLFLDVTNRCNMNCPICINNTPSMGYVFDPPREYFEKIFEHFGKQDPRPVLEMFGGEPTVRDDLIDLVKLAKKYGLRSRVVTNGLKLADEAYCRELVKTKCTILFSYDGPYPEMYRDLRGSEKYMAVKEKALENIRRFSKKKHVLMTLVAKGYNAERLHEFIQWCHERRDFIRGIYLMPLAHTWEEKDWDPQVDRITTEDLEVLVDKAFPQDPVEFLPAGFLSQIPNLKYCLQVKKFPFEGAHPNCESVYVMLSNGKEYVPLTRYLKTSPPQALKDLMEADCGLGERVRRFESGGFARFLDKLHLRQGWLKLMGVGMAWRFARSHVRMADLIRGSGLGKLGHAIALVFGLFTAPKARPVLEKHTNVQGDLEIIVLPFEDSYNLESDRMERCPSAFGYVNPKTGQADSMPMCAWLQIYKPKVMEEIARQYGFIAHDKDASEDAQEVESVSGD